MQLKSKLNDHPLLKLLIVLLILISSCKKEFYVNEKINPEMLQRNLTYKNGPQIATVNLSQFRAKINQAALGTLKKQFDIKDSPQRLMRIELPETYKGFTLITENIQMITNGRNTSYVFPVKLNSARAITFQNLTIVESANGISAFVTSYTPTREWIKNWRDGKPRKFDGDIAVTPLYLENGSMPTVLSLNTSLKNKKLNSLAPVTKTSLAAPGCTEYTFYYAVAYQCGSGNHWPGDPNCTLTGAGAAGYANLSSTTTICTGEGGGGGTTPTPDPDYNPCPEAPSLIDFRGVRGERLADDEVTTPCDLQPLPPAPILMPPHPISQL